MSSDQTITLSGNAAGTVRDPTPSERLLQAEVARLRGALAAERERCIVAVFAWAHDAINRKACATFSAPAAAEQIVKRLNVRANLDPTA